MLEKLQALEIRMGEIEEKLASPDLYSDPDQAARLLKEQKARYAPAPEDATWNPAFAEAVRELPFVSHLIDLLYDADASLRRSTAARITLDGTLAKMKNRLLAARGEEVADEDCKLAG